MKKIAVILCGSGYRDGSEIRESVATLWALSSEKVDVQCYAPDAQQADVVNCLTGDPMENESRNMLVESARIARGKVKPLSQLKAKDIDGILMPGGYGAAKNLCTFAYQGSKGKVIPDLQTVLQEMLQQKKPIGAICIAPAVVAIALKGKGLTLTVGDTSEASQEIEKLGHKHQITKASDFCRDEENKVFSTAAYMYDSAPLHEIFTGIQKVVREVCKTA
jgi:enhancing lycopene biosynthesis protein 2